MITFYRSDYLELQELNDNDFIMYLYGITGMATQDADAAYYGRLGHDTEERIFLN